MAIRGRADLPPVVTLYSLTMGSSRGQYKQLAWFATGFRYLFCGVLPVCLLVGLSLCRFATCRPEVMAPFHVGVMQYMVPREVAGRGAQAVS